ncbi:MAG: adenylyltransferase/cytidyltransferase family protein [Candidatus Brocadiae bacterium]|nr:adenylyltransferase/cytidyltransferase family protein [Candidatus Brocadiia bacterium]
MEKIISWENIAKIRKNKILVTTNGSFDILHVGHLRILQQAKKCGDILLVLVNSDVSVKLNKGDSRPIIPLAERMEMLAGLACVDYVMSFDEKEVLFALEKIKPDIHVKGGTFIPACIEKEKKLVECYGGKHICLSIVEGYSTTNIIEKIKLIVGMPV